MPTKKAKKSAGRYMVQLDPEVARIYQKISEESQVPLVRIVNTVLKGMRAATATYFPSKNDSLSK
jgi:hypothetical protein